jgi:hypothetical protein
MRITKPFHAVIQSTPTTAPEFENALVDGKSLRTLKIEQPIDTTFACSFEEVATALELLPRMFLEPDGSFVWVIVQNDSRYQLDGNLVDDGTKLLSVEFKGTCSEETLNELLSKLGWPQQELIFQLVQQGIYMAEVDFRELVFIN